MSNHHIKILVFLFPITLFSIFLYIKLLSPDTYIYYCFPEDSVIEYAQAFFYFISSMLSFFVSIKFLKNKLALHGVLYGILAIGLLFICLEEISWGQRLFNLKIFVYFEQHNLQHEITFHNLDIMKPILFYIVMLVGFYGAFAWLFVRLFVPRAKTKCVHIVNYLVPDWFISSYFFFVFFIFTLLHFMHPHQYGFLSWRDEEIAELLCSLGFLSFVVTNYLRLRTGLTKAATQTL